MKHLWTKALVILTLLITSFIIFNMKNHKVEYAVEVGNELSQLNFTQNSYVRRLNNVVSNEISIPEQFVKKAENEFLELYLEESALAIAVKDKSNGYVWFSYDVDNACLSNPTYDESLCSSYSDQNWRLLRSGITVNMFNQYSPISKTVLDEQPPILTYSNIEDGFKVHVNFEQKIMIKFDLYVSIKGKDLITEVPRDSVSEYNPLLFKSGKSSETDPDVSLKDIIVFPQLGATSMKQNGYIVIPDGSGAIISLPETPKFTKNYMARVYGDDIGYKEAASIDNVMLQIKTVKPLSRMTLPIYGVIHDEGNSGMLVISESGANYATYNYVSKSKQIKYYQSYFSYNYRTEYKQFQSRTDQGQHILGYQVSPNEFNLKQRYVFLAGKEADYVGVAKNYRHFLENENILKNNPSLKTDLSTKVNIIGNEVEMGIFKEKNIEITKYNEAVELVKTLEQDGYSNLAVTYKTFSIQNDAYRFDVFSHLGGRRQLKNMISYFNDHAVDFDYYVDYVNSYERSKYTASMLNRKSMSVLNMSYVYLFSYLNNMKYVPQFVEKDMKDYTKYQIDSLALGGLSDSVFTSTEKGIVKSSTQNMDYILQSLNNLNEHKIKVNLFNPDAYLFGYVNKYYDTPLTSSELMFVDATIPLLQLVTSGYMDMYSANLNFISNEQDTRLRLVEYGIHPSYLLTHANVYDLKFTNASNIYISEYQTLKNRMATNHEFIKEGLDQIAGQEMINHTLIDVGVSLVEYANGVRVVVNYTDHDYDYNGTNINAKEYEII